MSRGGGGREDRTTEEGEVDGWMERVMKEKRDGRRVRLLTPSLPEEITSCCFRRE